MSEDISRLSELRKDNLRGLHNKRVASDELEPIHAWHIAGFNQTHKQHASWPSSPVLVSLHAIRVLITYVVLC